MFWNSTLKREIRDLEREVDDLRRERNALQAEPDRLHRLITELEKKNSELTVKNAELTDQIRNQDEADLYFLSAQIMRRIEKGEKKDTLTAAMKEQKRLQQALAQSQAQQAAYPMSKYVNSQSPIADILGVTMFNGCREW